MIVLTFGYKENVMQWFAKRRLREYTGPPQKVSSIKGVHLVKNWKNIRVPRC